MTGPVVLRPVCLLCGAQRRKYKYLLNTFLNFRLQIYTYLGRGGIPRSTWIMHCSASAMPSLCPSRCRSPIASQWLIGLQDFIPRPNGDNQHIKGIINGYAAQRSIRRLRVHGLRTRRRFEVTSGYPFHAETVWVFTSLTKWQSISELFTAESKARKRANGCNRAYRNQCDGVYWHSLPP